MQAPLRDGPRTTFHRHFRPQIITNRYRPGNSSSNLPAAFNSRFAGVPETIQQQPNDLTFLGFGSTV